MPESTTSRPRPARLLLPVVVLVALVALTAFLATRQAGGSPDAAEAQVEASPSATSRPDPQADAAAQEALARLEALARREPGDPLADGEVDAPVVMVAYSEFQCPFCGRFARETEPTLVEDYVDEGLLRIEWRDFPYLGMESRTAALAARAAAQQDGFWEFHGAMFADQQPPNSGTLTPDFLADVAAGVGLDRHELLADMASAEVAAAVEHDFQEGQAIGVTGTPAFLINGRPVMGAQPTEVFVQTIEDALAEVGEQR